ncbi:MAG TPA: hypothetical protein VGC87_08870 [Pyrinomonadaceae bacterium]|jgi:hypothetical protein
MRSRTQNFMAAFTLGLIACAAATPCVAQRTESVPRYDPSSRVWSISIYKYDKEGRLEEVEDFDQNQRLRRRVRYYWNGPRPDVRVSDYWTDIPEGQVLKGEETTGYDGEGNEVSSGTAVFDKQGRQIGGAITRKNPDTGAKEELKYDPKTGKYEESAAAAPLAPPSPVGKDEKTKSELKDKSGKVQSARSVGVVYDRNGRTGDQVTLSLTNDPQRYENIPGLGVVIIINGSVGGNLEGVAVNLGDGRQQPASQPLTFQLSETASNIPVSLSSQGNPTPFAQGSVPVRPGGLTTSVARTGSPRDFRTPPVCQDMSFISGPLSGDGHVTRVMVDNQPAMIIAESPRTVYFDLPAGTSAGPHQLTVQDGARSAAFPIIKLGLAGGVDQPTLLRGQKTNYSVTVDFGELPDTIWQRGGGLSAELTNPSQIQQAAPGFHIPRDGEPGVVLLVITNESREAVSIKPSQGERVVLALHRQDFQNNRFTNRGEVQSKRSGSFLLNLLAQAFFAPIPGRGAGGDVLAGGPTTPEATPKNPVVAHQLPDDFKACEGDCNAVPSTKPSGQVSTISCRAITCKTPCHCELMRAQRGTHPDTKKPYPWERAAQPAEYKPSEYEYACFCEQ